MLLATNQQEKMPVSNQRTLVIEICLLENDFCRRGNDGDELHYVA